VLDLRDTQPGDLRDMLRCESHYEHFQLVEAIRVFRDVVTIDQAIANENVRDAVDKRDIAAWLDWKMNVGHHRGLGDTRIDDDQRAFLVALRPIAKDWMIVGDVCADQQDDVGGLEVGIVAGRAITAEGELISGDGAGYAERGVAVMVRRAKAELNELAEGRSRSAHLCQRHSGPARCRCRGGGEAC
jgi:hypothetical protein